jgi:hypothetical protein
MESIFVGAYVCAFNVPASFLNVQISDFGLSRISDHTTRDTAHWATVVYMAPGGCAGLAKHSAGLLRA